MAQITLNSSGVASNGSLLLQSNGTTTAVTVDTAQNVGVGVTPSAWGSSYKVLQLPGGNIGAFSTTAITTFQNAYDSGTGSYVYLTTAAASRYTQSQGQHQWFNAASGTAGNAITFTQAMTLDASGNLLVGRTSTINSGRLLTKGTTTDSTAYAFGAYASSDGELFSIRNDGAVFTGNASLSPYNNTTATAANVIVNSNGSLARSTSSLKYKKDVQNSIHGLVDLLNLRSVTYKQKNTDIEGNAVDAVFGGLIAEEVHAAGLTEFVQYADDGSPDALAYGNMVSLCIKSIQELNAKVEAQAVEIAALKGTA